MVVFLLTVFCLWALYNFGLKMMISGIKDIVKYFVFKE